MLLLRVLWPCGTCSRSKDPLFPSSSSFDSSRSSGSFSKTLISSWIAIDIFCTGLILSFETYRDYWSYVTIFEDCDAKFIRKSAMRCYIEIYLCNIYLYTITYNIYQIIFPFSWSWNLDRFSLCCWKHFWPLLLLLDSIDHVWYQKIPHHAECGGHVFVWKGNSMLVKSHNVAKIYLLELNDFYCNEKFKF